VAGGSGSDFIRTFGLPQSPEAGVKHLQGDNLYQIDVGRVTYNLGGRRVSEYFPNIAEAGFGADVVRTAERLPRFVGRVRYLLGFWATLVSFKINEGRVLLDGRPYEGPITNVVVANAQFFGGGMHIAPKAHPGDGRFDVLIQKGTKRDYVAGITKVFKGEHLSSPAIRLYHASVVEVVTPKPLRVEADGELLGVTPATFEIVPGALQLKL
ncbi:MAG: diacylglycerol/lipid kinase family protein, partial [Actinomycetota bacterium]